MRLLTFEELRQKKGHPYCRDHTRRLVKAGLFPKPIDVGPGRIAWSEEEVDEHYEVLASRRNETTVALPVQAAGPSKASKTASRTSPNTEFPSLKRQQGNSQPRQIIRTSRGGRS